MLKEKSLVQDLKRYSLITARESITYEALKQAGINKNLKLVPDPAFILKTKNLPLPKYFIENNTIGINVSPLVQRLERVRNITYANYEHLIKYILKETEFNVALIPHVVWEDNNDLIPLTQLYHQFKKQIVLF